MLFLPLYMGLAICLLYLWDKREKRKQKAEAERLVREASERKQRLLFILEQLPAIRTAVTGFFAHANQTDFAAGYFNYSEMESWKKTVVPLYISINKNNYSNLGLDPQDQSVISTFLDYYTNCASHRSAYNQAFIKQELESYRNFFDSVEGRSLDLQQRMAVITDEDNSLIIAGAGSGKTTTIVGKVSYILHRYPVPVDEILLISFTNKSASTLSARIHQEGLEAKTFHKFGKEVITQVEQRQPTIFDEKQYKTLISGFFQELLRDSAYLNKVTAYFTNFLKPVKSQEDFKNQGAYFQYLKDQNFSTYKTKSVHTSDRTTVKREIVKSIEECAIANFLLFNNIDYEYEYPYPHQTATQSFRQYKPDFTLNPKTQPVYLEHFALNKKGNVPPFFADAEKGESLQEATKKYTDGIAWKRKLHEQYGTALIETFSHEMFDNVLFENLTKNLLAAGVPVIPKPPEEIWNIINEAAKDEVENIINLFQTFITLMKSNHFTPEELSNKNKTVTDKFHRQRNSLFLEIISPVYEKYQQYLAERKEIDFSDMIHQAAVYLSTGKFRKKFSYVIIDEFQDISIGRYQLVKAIKEQNPGCKLFCVGDDWQSIYRFTGSDITLFKDFENYFGYTEKMFIETTYRFHEPLLTLSSNFILKNPGQSRKQLRGITSTNSTEYHIVYSQSEDEDDTDALEEIFFELMISGKALGKEILLLGRYSFDLKRIKNKNQGFRIDKKEERVEYVVESAAGKTIRLAAQFMTVHKAKGLEADIIIVLNCNAGKLGFPSGMTDDPVLNLLLSNTDQFENGEERRLFYVAMTRAKESVYFVADYFSKSKFIAELETEQESPAIKKCPRCITADLVKKSGLKNGKEWAFYGCANYRYGCDYRQWLT